jgi:hypothetical protein
MPLHPAMLPERRRRNACHRILPPAPFPSAGSGGFAMHWRILHALLAVITAAQDRLIVHISSSRT